jgi:regulator of protease activity HflC (stomatin/prohibitin superfamily)
MRISAFIVQHGSSLDFPKPHNFAKPFSRMERYVEATMNALEKNIAEARGEALAANLLASAAIQAALAIISNRDELFDKMSEFIDVTLNISGPGKGDANDEFNTQVRETARFQATQTLDAIAAMFRNPPANNV